MLTIITLTRHLVRSRYLNSFPQARTFTKIEDRELRVLYLYIKKMMEAIAKSRLDSS